MQSGRGANGRIVGTTRVTIAFARGVASVMAMSLAAAAGGQTFVGAPVVFGPSGSNLVQTQTVTITVAAATTIRSISIPVGFVSAPEFTLVDMGGCTEDGATVNAVGTVCSLLVRFRPAAAGLRTASLIVTDGNGSATAFGLSGVGYYPQVAITPAAAKIVAGLGPSAAAFSGDGDVASAAGMNLPQGIAVDPSGNVYVADTGNNVVRMLDAFGNITTVAGGGAAADGGLATSARLNAPTYLAVDSAGNLYISDTGNNVVRRVAMSTSRTITTVAGSYAAGFSGDGSAATVAQLNGPQGIVADGVGNLYVVDGGNNRIRMVDSGGTITTVAGTGVAGFNAAATAAGQAQFNLPTGLAMDLAQNLYVSDAGNHAVREISGGMVTVVAGTGTAGKTGDGGAATAATLMRPAGLALSAAGDVYVADADAGVVRKVQASDGVIETVAGLAKDAGLYTAGVLPSTDLRMNGPTGLAFDSQLNLYIADSGNNVVREVTTAPGELLFAAQATGTFSSPLTFKIANTGNAPLSLVSVAAANSVTSTNFVLANSGTTPCGSSVTVGGHCEYAVSFAPQSGTTANGEIDVTNVANNPNFNAVEPIYLAGGLLSPITIGPATLATAALGSSYSAAVTATGGYGALTATVSGTLPPGIGAAISNGVVTLSGTPTTAGSYTFTVYASDVLGETAAQTYTLQVAPSTITFTLSESIHVFDAPVETPGLTLTVTETVHVADAPVEMPGLTLTVSEAVHVADSVVDTQQLILAVMETVHVADGAVNTPGLVLAVTETVHVTDGTVTLPQLNLGVLETVHVADGVVNTPGLTLAVTEMVHVTDAPRLIPSGGVVVVRRVTLADNAGMLTTFSNSVAVVSSASGTSSPALTAGSIAYDGSGNAWIVTSGNNSLNFVSRDGTVSTAFMGGGLNQPVSVAIDGSGSVWVTNGNGSVSEFSSTGVALSPASGFTGGVTAYSSPTGISIGVSGSVWVANSGNNTTTEILGAAGPAAPLATALTNSTTGVRP